MTTKRTQDGICAIKELYRYKMAAVCCRI